MLEVDDLSIGILAGGKATRMNNQDKGLVNLKGKPFVERLIEIIKPHTPNIIINANRNISEYEKYNYPVIKDEMNNFQGPLSGIYSMLKASKKKYLFTLPCDCPNFRWEVVEIFMKNVSNKELYIAHNHERSQPVFMLISKSKINSLQNFLENGERKIDAWYQQNDHEYIYFEKEKHFFDNINTLNQLKEYNEE